MKYKFHVLIANITWVIVLRPHGANIVRSKWLYRKTYKVVGLLTSKKRDYLQMENEKKKHDMGLIVMRHLAWLLNQPLFVLF